MTAISHNLEKDVAQILHKKASFVQYFIKQIVQFRSARFKGSLLVRPGTLWTYVLNPSRRTCKHPLNVRPQSQGRTSIGFLTGEFDVLCLLGIISSLSVKRVFATAVNFSWFYRILKTLINVTMKAKNTNQLQKDTKRLCRRCRGHHVFNTTSVMPATRTLEIYSTDIKQILNRYQTE